MVKVEAKKKQPMNRNNSLVPGVACMVEGEAKKATNEP